MVSVAEARRINIVSLWWADAVSNWMDGACKLFPYKASQLGCCLSVFTFLQSLSVSACFLPKYFDE